MYGIKPVIPYMLLVSESQRTELILSHTFRANNIITADWNILLLERDRGWEEERRIKGEGDSRQQWENEPCSGCTGL